MSADTRNGPPDVPFRQQGIGTAGQTFRCGKCATPRALLGRRLRRVNGLRTWVCGDCADAARLRRQA